MRNTNSFAFHPQRDVIQSAGWVPCGYTMVKTNHGTVRSVNSSARLGNDGVSPGCDTRTGGCQRHPRA